MEFPKLFAELKKEIEMRKSTQEMITTLIKNGLETKVDQQEAANLQWMDSLADRGGRNGKAVDMKRERMSLCTAERQTYDPTDDIWTKQGRTGPCIP